VIAVTVHGRIVGYYIGRAVWEAASIGGGAGGFGVVKGKTAAEEAEDAALRERIRAMRAGEVPNRGDGDWVPEGRVTSAELLRRLGDK